MILLLECGIIQARSGSGQKFAGASHQNCGCAHCLVRWLSSLSGLIPTICREGVETETISRSHSPHGECGFQLYPFGLPASLQSHSPHGECGFQHRNWAYNFMQPPGHSPHGECGFQRLRLEGQVGRHVVTLRTGSVDFNAAADGPASMHQRHSPHGECGFQLAGYVAGD